VIVRNAPEKIVRISGEKIVAHYMKVIEQDGWEHVRANDWKP